MLTNGYEKVMEKDWESAKAIIGDLRDIDPAAARTLQDLYEEHYDIDSRAQLREKKDDDAIEQGREDALNG